jgi:fumarate reductase flavoprotein subunit
MLRVALCVALGARDRTESRGAHFREDHPRRDDRNCLSRTLATWPNPDDELPTLSYDPLDVMRMEMPPGFRGYGARDHAEHPDSATRQQQIDAVRARLGDTDRFVVQQELMPFAHLLPERYRGRNERLESTEITSV